MNKELKDVALKIFLAKANLLGRYGTDQDLKDASRLIAACFDYADIFLIAAKEQDAEPNTKAPESKL